MCTEGVFNALTGEYAFTETDKRVYPPGTYTFTVTGQLNGVSSSITFDLNMIDPCTQAVLTLTEGVFDDLNTHVLRKVEQSYSWKRSAITSIDVANCGGTTINFYADSNPIPISGTYLSFFYDQQNGVDPEKFTLLYSEDAGLAGLWNITYQV